ncbi:hypothetical protein C9374_011453 [Naegleria lovaniensis]|uniref:Uncharacterized protein n=1 Tax=Naegleria lovaniensis TaxID=51637 RepID=A0AA88H0Y2_NAELO|nr:uncharacterized protein C9374_011453 [Naegleria lovaniensis]KAG2392728.1 hypothetical protein C9374_011453 [Naegleria lovaniensis]
MILLATSVDNSHQETFDLSLSNRIFFFYGTQDRFINTKGTYAVNSNCTCQASSFAVNELRTDASSYQYCYFDSSNSVTVLMTGPGFCNFSMAFDNDDYFLYISDFYLTPNGKVIPDGNGFHEYGLNFTSGDVPVSYSLFSMLFERSGIKSLRSSLIPSINAAFTKSGSNSLFTAMLSFAQIQSMLDVATFDTYQRYKRLDFDVVMDSLIYPVSDGVLYYSPLNASKIVLSPSIIRFGELTFIELGTLNSQPLFTPSNSLMITICGSNFTSMSGAVTMVTESLVRAQIICTNPSFRNGMTTLSYSQSGDVQMVSI